jgi:hypothetical protein
MLHEGFWRLVSGDDELKVDKEQGAENGEFYGYDNLHTLFRYWFPWFVSLFAYPFSFFSPSSLKT